MVFLKSQIGLCSPPLQCFLVRDKSVLYSSCPPLGQDKMTIRNLGGQAKTDCKKAGQENTAPLTRREATNKVQNGNFNAKIQRNTLDNIMLT